MDKITQDMKYRYSLVRYALSQGVCKASRKSNKGRSYIYFWIKRFDGEISSLASRSKRPKHHPLEHSQDEIELIRRYWSHNQELGLFEFWFKLRNQGYTRHYVSLYRVMRRKTKYKPKPYEQMRYAGQRVQVDVKIVPGECVLDKGWKHYYQYTAIDEFNRLRYLEGFQTEDTLDRVGD